MLKRSSSDTPTPPTTEDTPEKEYEDFLYTVSHDLHAPLRHARQYSELLLSSLNGKIDTSTGNSVEGIVSAVTRAENMLEGLVELSRITTLAQPLAPVDTAEIVQHAIEMHSPTLTRKNIEIDIPKSLPTVNGDAEQLTRVFYHLLDNALKFHDPDIPLLIHLHYKKKRSNHLFSIHDTGIGIDPQFHTRIFQVFKSLHPEGAYPGLGMGLALCKKIITRHGGEVWVESSEGNGATFFFTLPAE